MLSLDEGILKEGSEANQRMKDYGGIFEELHIVLYKRPGFGERSISANIRVYPTNSLFKFLYFFSAYKICKRIVREREISRENSVISAQDAVSAIPAFLIGRVFGIPVQLQVHTDFLNPYFKKESLKNYLRYILYKFFVRRADCVRVVSKWIRDFLVGVLGIHGEIITVLPIFVDTKAIKSIKPETDLHKKYAGYKKIILMASRITNEKNIDMAIRAVSGASEEIPGFLLLIVGNGQMKKFLMKKYGKYLADAESAGPEQGKFLFFEDAADFPTLVSYYKTADLFLLTSDYEGYGRTIIEALSCGLPVISTDVGIAKEVLGAGGAGRIVPVRDEKALSREIESVLSDDPLLKRMKENAAKIENLIPYADKNDYLEKFKLSFSVCGVHWKK